MVKCISCVTHKRETERGEEEKEKKEEEKPTLIPPFFSRSLGCLLWPPSAVTVGKDRVTLCRFFYCSCTRASNIT